MTTTPPAPIEITALNCKARFEEWIKTRGGVAVWTNQDLSNLSRPDSYTPATTAEGKSVDNGDKPHWAYSLKEVITDLSRFKFAKEMKEVKRFRVAVDRRGRGLFGMRFDLTSASSQKVRKWCSKMKEQYKTEPCYHFDYEKQECVIEVPIFE